MIHKNSIEKYEGTLKELTEDLGDLRYDTLAEFLQLLAEKIKIDAAKDKSRKRYKLAGVLDSCSLKLKDASEFIEQAWEICKPYME